MISRSYLNSIYLVCNWNIKWDFTSSPYVSPTLLMFVDAYNWNYNRTHRTYLQYLTHRSATPTAYATLTSFARKRPWLRLADLSWNKKQL